MIIVEEAAENLTTLDFSRCGWFISRNGGLLVKALMWSATIVEVNELDEHPTQVSFIDYQDVI